MASLGIDLIEIRLKSMLNFVEFWSVWEVPYNLVTVSVWLHLSVWCELAFRNADYIQSCIITALVMYCQLCYVIKVIAINDFDNFDNEPLQLGLVLGGKLTVSPPYPGPQAFFKVFWLHCGHLNEYTNQPIHNSQKNLAKHVVSHWNVNITELKLVANAVSCWLC